MTREPPHPVVYLFLILPFGALGGYVTVSLAYTLAHGGLRTVEVAALIAIYLAPQAWKFLWAPIVDATLSRKRWYVLGTATSALGTVALAARSSVVSASGVSASAAGSLAAGSFDALGALLFLASVASTLLGMSAEALTAHTSGEDKGRAGGWLQAGNLGGNGLGGGAALWLSQHVAAVWVGAALGASYLLCCLALCFVSEPAVARHGTRIVRKLGEVVRDLWHVLRARSGYLALLVVFLPMSTCAAMNLWSAVAADWHASEGIVALVNGVLGGVVSAAGCLAGGYVCDRFDRKAVYLAYGLLQALCAAAMAAGPRTAGAFAAFTLLYAFISGLTYAAFSAVTLEAIGLGAAATKYNVYASLSNIPLSYMTVIEGWAHGRWGAGGFLVLEAVVGVASLMVFGGAAAFSGRRAAIASA
ncbi:MAG: MFS transporter [Steroidobacteraceae bacterium]